MFTKVLSFLAIASMYINIMFSYYITNNINIQMFSLFSIVLQFFIFKLTTHKKVYGCMLGALNSFGLAGILYLAGWRPNIVVVGIVCTLETLLFIFNEQLKKFKDVIYLVCLGFCTLNHSILDLYNTEVIEGLPIIVYVGILSFYTYNQKGGWNIVKKNLSRKTSSVKK